MKPAWLKIAEANIGVKEIPGPKSNSIISGWLTKLKAWWTDDGTPWCGTFVAHCLSEAGMPVAKNWFRARSWAEYGANLRSTHVAPGAIVVFRRGNAGHVGFYVGEDPYYYHILGGNQSDKVNIMRIAKTRCIAIRWPKGEPVIGGPVKKTGGVISTNEG